MAYHRVLYVSGKAKVNTTFSHGRRPQEARQIDLFETDS